MVKVPTLTTCLLVAAITGATTATKINFVNKCATPVQLYHSERFQTLEKLGDIAAGSSLGRDFSGQAHMFRHGFDTDATLAEFSMPNDGKVWFDISVIPPMPGHCRSFDDCKKVTGKRGFNVPMNIVPKTNANGRNCRTIACAGDDQASCADAYHFPDDVKTHDCPATTEFDVVFCPNGSGGGSSGEKPTQAPPTQQQTTTPSVNQNNNKQNHNNNYTPPPTHNNNNQNNNNGIGFDTTDLGDVKQGTIAPTTDDVANEAQQQTMTPSKASGALGTVRATYTYKGKQAGNVAGSYDRVTQLNGCVKQRVSLHSPVGPLSEEVSLVFRGPMDIYNIAVFDGSAGNSSFTRVSSYTRDGGENQNLVFMNNKNIDYSGQQRHGPQGFAGADGVSPATQSTKLKGVLNEATNPHAMGAGPGVQTGAEVNIMTSKKCDGQCLGYHGANDYHGWGGGRKIFITKVQMPHGAAPNQPAIWMLNAQVLHSNQYGCNCRGMGAVGGCGELDIAEVIETNANRDKVTTHYYFYDGKVLSPGGDNFAQRPYDRPAAYATIIDDQHADGMVKIIELADWDFTSDEISPAMYQQMLAA